MWWLDHFPHYFDWYFMLQDKASLRHSNVRSRIIFVNLDDTHLALGETCTNNANASMGLLPDTLNWGLRMRQGMPGTFSPPLRFSDPDMHYGTCVTHVPWCMSGSLSSGFLWSRRRGKCSRHPWRMRNPQFCVSGKRPMKKWARIRTVRVSRTRILSWCYHIAWWWITKTFTNEQMVA